MGWLYYHLERKFGRQNTGAHGKAKALHDLLELSRCTISRDHLQNVEDWKLAATLRAMPLEKYATGHPAGDRDQAGTHEQGHQPRTPATLSEISGGLSSTHQTGQSSQTTTDGAHGIPQGPRLPGRP